MTQDTEHRDTKRAARRRLVRGAFASPAVLALHSGSAFAMASNLRCVSNQLDHPVLAPANADQYVRVELYSVTVEGTTPSGTSTTSPTDKREKTKGPKKTSGGTSSDVVVPSTTESQTTFYVKGDDVDALAKFARIDNGFLKVGEWQEFDVATEKLVPGVITSTSALPGTPTNSNRFVLIRIDGSVDGSVSIVGVVESPNDSGSAVSTLCWSSFAGTAG